MDEKAKELLYKQLQDLYKLYENESGITQETFMNLTDAQALSYIFWYRDNNLRTSSGERREHTPYIELPNMDFSGQDLSKTVLPKEITGSDEDIIGTRLRIFSISI